MLGGWEEAGGGVPPHFFPPARNAPVGRGGGGLGISYAGVPLPPRAAPVVAGKIIRAGGGAVLALQRGA